MRQRILIEIRRLAAQNNGIAPGRQVFERETAIPASAWRGKYWARWSDAIAEAGYSPNEMSQRTDATVIFSKLVQACRHFGKIPTEPELKMYRQIDGDFPYSGVRTSFRTKADMLDGLREWLVDNVDFDDVAQMLPDTTTITPEKAKSKEGYVYLIRSGGHYKIGRSEELERRVKEIRIALPEAATLDHTIRTDDPAGIEAYWHRRFADRRVNGEWFKLSTADVAAFKRRKFQ